MPLTKDFSALPSRANGDFTRFTVNIPQATLDDLQTLLRLSSIGKKTYENTRPDRQLGVLHDWMTEAVETWRTSFDWSHSLPDLQPSTSTNLSPYIGAYMKLTSIPFPTTKRKSEMMTGEITVYISLPSFLKNPDAVSLLLLHGWPGNDGIASFPPMQDLRHIVLIADNFKGSFIEFLPTLERLRERHEPNNLSYHLVVPSLPGYTFSSPPPLDKDFHVEDVARLFDKLVIDLGFGDGYVVQGGDLGSKVARVMAVEHSSCKGQKVHLSCAAFS